MKKTLLFFMVLILFLSASCSLSKEIASGRYYLGNDNEIYIEIIDNTKIAFNNADFTAIEETFLLDFGLDLNIENGVSFSYEANDAYDRIFVDIYDSDAGDFRPAIIIYYSDKDKTLTLSDIIYTKR